MADIVIVGAIRAMIRAHPIGHTLSDNGFYNFGWLQGNVVIIDAGSRRLDTAMRRSEFNKQVMSKFWRKLQLLVHLANLQKHRDHWSLAGWDMSTALKAYDDAWLSMCASSEYMQVLESVSAEQLEMPSLHRMH